jgi:MoaA/NifB/PqqE/SkfB family radical SAM enzyme
MELGRLDIELTERCNNNCVHCCINLPPSDCSANLREMDSGMIKKILKEARKLGCIYLRLTGGEPLLRKDFEEIYVFARKQGLRVIISTNATLINDSLIRLFERIPPLMKIEVSMYGLKAKTYEAVTKSSGSFTAAYRGLRLLSENKIPFLLKYTVLPVNINELDCFEGWAKSFSAIEQTLPLYNFMLDLRCRRDNISKNAEIKCARL